MSLDQAIRSILGDQLAADIMALKGRSWALSVAVSAADSSHDHQAISVLRAELKRRKCEKLMIARGPKNLV